MEGEGVIRKTARSTYSLRSTVLLKLATDPVILVSRHTNNYITGLIPIKTLLKQIKTLFKPIKTLLNPIKTVFKPYNPSVSYYALSTRGC